MITVLFTCKECGKDRQPVSVRERNKVESVTQWMEDILNQVKDAHTILSPDCKAKKVDLWIPSTEDKRVGEK